MGEEILHSYLLHLEPTFISFYGYHIYISILCCISISMMKHQQISYWNWDLPWFSNSYWKCMKCMFVDSLMECTCPPNCAQYLVWSNSWSWRRSPISFKHMFLWCLFFDPHPTIHKSNTIKTNNQITPTYLWLFSKVWSLLVCNKSMIITQSISTSLFTRRNRVQINPPCD